MISLVFFILKVKISTYEFGDINLQSTAVTLELHGELKLTKRKGGGVGQA